MRYIPAAVAIRRPVLRFLPLLQIWNHIPEYKRDFQKMAIIFQQSTHKTTGFFFSLPDFCDFLRVENQKVFTRKWKMNCAK